MVWRKGNGGLLQAKTVTRLHCERPLERRKGLRRVEQEWKKANTFHRSRDWGLETELQVSLLAHIPERICESLTDLNGKVE